MKKIFPAKFLECCADCPGLGHENFCNIFKKFVPDINAFPEFCNLNCAHEYEHFYELEDEGPYWNTFLGKAFCDEFYYVVSLSNGIIFDCNKLRYTGVMDWIHASGVRNVRYGNGENVSFAYCAFDRGIDFKESSIIFVADGTS